MIFNCVYCDYKTSRKNSYLSHQRSNKHQANQKQYLLKFGVVPENHSEIEDTNPETTIIKPTTQKSSRSKRKKSRTGSKNIQMSLEEIEQIDLNVEDLNVEDLNLEDLESLKDIEEDNSDESGKNNLDDKEIIRLVSFSNMDDFYKTVSSSFLQQIRFFVEFELLRFNKSQQEAFDYIKKKYCYLDSEILSELLKDIRISLIVSNLIDDKENPFEIIS